MHRHDIKAEDIINRGGGTLTLIYESKGDVGQHADSPDNITVTPRGGLLACEDDASSEFVDTHPLAPGIEISLDALAARAAERERDRLDR